MHLLFYDGFTSCRHLHRHHVRPFAIAIAMPCLLKKPFRCHAVSLSLSMAPKRKAPEQKAQERKWPSKYVIQESLWQYKQLHIDKIEGSLSWCLRVWPGCAIMVVAEADELFGQRREVVRKWGEENLRPGNYDPTGLHQ